MTDQPHEPRKRRYIRAKQEESRNKGSNGEDFASQVAAGNWLTRVLFQPRVLMGLALLVSSTVFIPLVWESLPDLSERDEYRLQTTEIQIKDPPHWIPHDLVRQVVEMTGLPDEVCLLDRNLNRELAQAFRLHPWVLDVITIRQSRTRRQPEITMELKFRRPVAMVEVQRNLYPVMYPIDAEGILLPASDFSMADAERYPIIKNVTSEPPGPAGMSWGDVRIIGAARLAEKLVGQYWNEFGLTAIYVPQDVKANTTIDDLIYELETSGGSRIIWGRPPGTGHPGEISADKKIGRLKYLLALFGDFDKPHGPYLINIRHWQDISRHPISIQQSRALK